MEIDICPTKGIHKKKLERLQRLYDFMIGYQLENQIPVTADVVMAHMDIKRNTVYIYMRVLKENGYVDSRNGLYFVNGLEYKWTSQIT